MRAWQYVIGVCEALRNCYEAILSWTRLGNPISTSKCACAALDPHQGDQGDQTLQSGCSSYLMQCWPCDDAFNFLLAPRLRPSAATKPAAYKAQA